MFSHILNELVQIRRIMHQAQTSTWIKVNPTTQQEDLILLNRNIKKSIDLIQCGQTWDLNDGHIFHSNFLALYMLSECRDKHTTKASELRVNIHHHFNCILLQMIKFNFVVKLWNNIYIFNSTYGLFILLFIFSAPVSQCYTLHMKF